MFFGVLPGCVLAVDVPVNFGSIQGTFDLITPTGVRYPASFGGFSTANSGGPTVSLGPYAYSSFNVGGLENFPDIVFSGFNNRFSVPVSFQASGLELTELLIEWEPLPRFLAFRDFAFSSGVVNSPFFFDYVPLSMYASGALTVNFSDGTSKSIPLSNVSANRLSFSVKKDNSSNQYLLSSEDFNLSSDDDVGGLTIKSRSDNSSNLPTDEVYLGDLNIRNGQASISGRDLSNNISVSGGSNIVGNLVTPAGAVNSSTFAINTAIRSFGLYGFSILLNFADLSNILLYDVGSTTAGISVKNAHFSIAEKGIIDEAPVTIIPASENVTVSGFSFTGTLTSVRTRFEHPLDMSDLSFSFDSGSNMNPTRFNNGVSIIFYPYVTYGDKEGVLAHMASTLDGIYSALRFDLPLTIRRLLIPTEEEVSDVVEEAVEDIKNNAGGLGEAVDIVDTEFKEIQAAISSSKKAPVIFPAFDINVFGYQVKLWDNIDFAPYLNNELVRLIMAPAELMLIYILATLLVRHMYLMWICITSGSSYFAFIKGLKSDL